MVHNLSKHINSQTCVPHSGGGIAMLTAFNNIKVQKPENCLSKQKKIAYNLANNSNGKHQFCCKLGIDKANKLSTKFVWKLKATHSMKFS